MHVNAEDSAGLTDERDGPFFGKYRAIRGRSTRLTVGRERKVGNAEQREAMSQLIAQEPPESLPSR
jgi:hypothetical protein